MSLISRASTPVGFVVDEPIGRARFSAVSAVVPSLGSGRRLVVLLVALVGVFAFVVPGSAWATTGHDFAGQFGGFGDGDGQFGEPQQNGPGGLAVMPSTGEVFALDTATSDGSAAPRVQRFDAAGVFQSAFAIDPKYNALGSMAVDPAGFGAVYVSSNRSISDEDPNPFAAVAKYSAAGVFAYELDYSSSGTTINNPVFGAAPLAVDPVDGTLYVTAAHDDGRQVIDRFDGSTGAFIDFIDGANGSPDGTGFGCPSGLAVDGSHRVYVLDACKQRVDQYGADGAFGATVYDGSAPGPDGSSRAPAAVAVDPVSDEVYVAHAGPVGTQVTHFTAGGAAPVYTFDALDVGGVRAMAASGLGTVYTSDATNPFVERFTRFEGPTVTTEPADPINPRDATLNGMIDPEGVDSTYHFEYGLDQTYGSSTEESDPVSGSDPVLATAIVTGLSADPNTTYHFRIVGTSASGSITGNDQTFTTPPAPPALDGAPAFASAMTTTGATLNATLNPNGSDTTFHFEFGSVGPCDANPCTSTASVDAGAGHGDRPVTVDLTGLLAAGTTYHYRLVADNGTGGVQEGADGTFSTAPATPASAHQVGALGADLHGVINLHGEPTSYHFEYGTTTAYGKTTPEVDGGSGSGDKDVSQPTGRLIPGTTYHFRVVATSNGQTTTSDDATFTTGKVPVAVLAYPTGISTTEAVLAGMVDTHGSGGSYSFHVESLDGLYSTTTTAAPAPAGEGMRPVTARLTGLPAGETFGVVLSVISNQVTANASVVFATPPLAKRPDRPTPSVRCTAPTLNPYDGRPHPGQTITLIGRDLGAGGTATLAGKRISPRRWSTSRVSVLIPRRAIGTLPLTINCGHVSNTITLKIAPNNKFTITKTKINANTAILSLRLPGAGKVRTTSRHTSPKTTRIAKAGTATIKVKLTNTATDALAKTNTRKLKTTIHVRYTPNRGQPNTKTRTLTFKRTP